MSHHPNKLLIIGHRGDRQNFEENTIEGIESALKRGADGVEMDVYYKPNKGIYLTHQYLHDTAKDYPKLENIIKKYSTKGILQIEIKTPEVKAVKEVAKLINKYKVTNYELTSSVFPLIKYMREILPKANIGLIANPLVEDWWTEDFENYFLTSYLKLTKADGIHLSKRADFWNKQKVEYFQNQGFRVCSHLTSDSKKEYEKMEKMGINSCTADNLDVLKRRK